MARRRTGAIAVGVYGEVHAFKFRAGIRVGDGASRLVGKVSAHFPGLIDTPVGDQVEVVKFVVVGGIPLAVVDACLARTAIDDALGPR